MKVIVSTSEEYPMYQPQNGWAEQNQKIGIMLPYIQFKKFLAKSKINPEDVKRRRFIWSNAWVMLDENNEVIRPSIIWCDQRTVKNVKKSLLRLELKD